jgi:hypothetical protein
MTIEAIKDAILALPEEDRLRLEDWLADQWDEQMVRDFSPGGRGAPLADRIDAEIASGEFRPLDRR